MWNLASVHFETTVSVSAMCTVDAKGAIGSEIIVDTPDGTPGDEAQLEACLGPFRDSGNFNTRQVHGFYRTYHRLKNHFGRT
jgi:hypothetical protein